MSKRLEPAGTHRLGRLLRRAALLAEQIMFANWIGSSGLVLYWDMDRSIKLEHLAEAEAHVAEGQRHIDRQEQIVAELDRDGHDTKQAWELLAIFRSLQIEHIAHRDRLLRELKQ